MTEDELVARAQRQLDERFAAHQVETRQKMLQAMRENGMDPAYIYAAEKTGIMPFQETMHLLSEEDLLLWQAAYDEYPGRPDRGDVADMNQI